MKDILIIGAGTFQVPLIYKAQEMGFVTHVFAWKEGAVGKEIADYFYPISIINKKEILAVAKEINPVGVLSIASDLATITVNYIAHHLNLTGNPIEYSAICTHKYLMREALQKAGLKSPRFYKDLNDLYENQLKFPLICKPSDRSGSRGVNMINCFEELEKYVKIAQEESLRGDFILEEFIEGKEYSVETISWQGKHYLVQITEKETSGPPNFIESAQHQPANLSKELVNKIFKEVAIALNTLNVQNGAGHTEIMITSTNEIYIIELGVRMGGDFIGSHLVPLSTGYDYLEAVINICCGVVPKLPSLNHIAHTGVYFIFSQGGKVFEIVDETNQNQEIFDKQIYVKIGDELKPSKHSGERIAYYMYKSKKKCVYDKPLINIFTD